MTEIALRRLRTHRLVGEPFAAVEEAVGWLGAVQSQDYPGASLSFVLSRLVAEYEDARTRREIIASYARLRSDPEAWADYVTELEEWDAVTGDRPSGE